MKTQITQITLQGRICSESELARTVIRSEALDRIWLRASARLRAHTDDS